MCINKLSQKLRKVCGLTSLSRLLSVVYPPPQPHQAEGCGPENISILFFDEAKNIHITSLQESDTFTVHINTSKIKFTTNNR